MRLHRLATVAVVAVAITGACGGTALADDSTRWLATAWSELAEGNVQGARAAVVRAVEADPMGVSTLRRATTLLNAAGVDDEALEMARLAETRLADSGAADSPGMHAEALALDLLFGRAIQADLDQTLAGGPEAACALTAVIETHARSGQVDEALALTRRVTGASPTCVSAWDAGLEGALRTGRWDEVLAQTQGAAAAIPAHAPRWGVLEAEALRRLDRVDAAIDRLVVVLKSEPTGPGLEALAEVLVARRHDDDVSFRRLDGRCDADSNDVSSCFLAGALASARGEHGHCLGRMEQVRPGLSGRHRVDTYAALCHYGLGRPDLARPLVERAATRAPSDAVTLLARARILFATDRARSRRDVKRLLDMRVHDRPVEMSAPRLRRLLADLDAGRVPAGWEVPEPAKGAAPVAATPDPAAAAAGDGEPGSPAATADRRNEPGEEEEDGLPWLPALLGFLAAVLLFVAVRRRAP